MKDRCNNKNSKDYRRYGARGISVCDAWSNDFLEFYNWAYSHGYKDFLTIDRIDSKLGYNPKNCQWISLKENSRKLECNKLNMDIAEQIRQEYLKTKESQYKLAKKYGVNQSQISRILNNKIWI